MSRPRKIRVLLMAGLLALGAVELGGWLSLPGVPRVTSIVQAEVGRPLTPVSVAGVARRTSRRN
jgi:hypothetical protein